MTEKLNSDLRGRWVFVDDSTEEMAAFVDRLREPPVGIEVVPLSPSEGRERLLTDAAPLGVLMDVDLSAKAGEHGTGLGIAQDIRAKQKAKAIPDYPVVRFANPAPVRVNVGGDPASDDLFDDRVGKNDVARDPNGVGARLRAVLETYHRLSAIGAAEPELQAIFGVGARELEDWVHPLLISRVRDGLAYAVHVAAGTYLRAFLQPPGPLVDRHLLAIRLGATSASVDACWAQIATFADSFRFRGIGSGCVSRWWARGLEEAWDLFPSATAPLALTSAVDRVKGLNEALGTQLEPLPADPGSPGNRPWRWCVLALEGQPERRIPVDPRYAPQVAPRSENWPWMDPLNASLGEAVRNLHDRRLDRSEVERLKLEAQ